MEKDPRPLFIFESLCASGVLSPLRTEGWAMLSALVEDFMSTRGVEIWTLLDHHCSARLGHRCWAAEPGREKTLFRDLAAKADATLIIAPETDGVLAQFSRTVLEMKGRLLGCSPEAVNLTADKRALAEHWRQHHVPTPALWKMNEGHHAESDDYTVNEPVRYPAVLKPRDGAGSQATFLMHDRNEWNSCLEQARREMPDSEFVVQAFVPGQPTSIAFIIAPGRTVPLLSAAQHLSNDGRFHYLGGHLPLEPALAQRAVALGRRAIACVPGLRGYVGVDLILGENAEDDWAIEINPRLTTSYLGLRQLAQDNLAQLMVEEQWRAEPREGPDDAHHPAPHGARLAMGQKPVSWRSGTVTFTADGKTICV